MGRNRVSLKSGQSFVEFHGAGTRAGRVGGRVVLVLVVLVVVLVVCVLAGQLPYTANTYHCPL
jgi:hypothetical protein